MIRKKVSAQNIVIIILSILLLVSIGFGFTYSYYNGKSNLAKGSVTTASLAIELHDTDGKIGTFEISAPINDSVVVCGNDLLNAELNILNKSNRDTYIMVLYSLRATKLDTGEDVTYKLNNTPALDFQDDKLNTNVWTPITYSCEYKEQVYTCLVGSRAFDRRASSEGNLINILPANSLKTPGAEWGNELQGCCVTFSVVAYAMQSDNLVSSAYWPAIDNAGNNKEARCQAIAKAILQLENVDAPLASE